MDFYELWQFRGFFCSSPHKKARGEPSIIFYENIVKIPQFSKLEGIKIILIFAEVH